MTTGSRPTRSGHPERAKPAAPGGRAVPSSESSLGSRQKPQDRQVRPGVCALSGSKASAGTAPLFRSCACLPWTRVCGASAHASLCLVTIPTKRDYEEEQERTLPLLTSTCRGGNRSGERSPAPGGPVPRGTHDVQHSWEGKTRCSRFSQAGGQGRHGQQSRVAGR